MGRKTTKTKHKKHKVKTNNLEKDVQKTKSKKKGSKTREQNDDTEGASCGKENGQINTANYSVEQLLEKAEAYVDSFQYELAERFCRRALETDADNVQALETSGTLLLQLGDTEGAKHCFGRAIELQPATGHSKYMYMGQLMTGEHAVQCFTSGINILLKQQSEGAEKTDGDANTISQDLSSAYCALAEIYLTDECFQEDAEQKCKDSLDKALAADGKNAEVHHLMASFFLSKDEPQKAKEALDKGVSLWLPQMRAQADPQGALSNSTGTSNNHVAGASCNPTEGASSVDSDADLFDPLATCSVSYSARVNTTKMFIELEEYSLASEILELLLDEDDEVVEVWYLLGWLNYLQGNEYFSNARFYLKKGQQVAAKVGNEDEEIGAHIEELLNELGPGDENDDDGGGDDDADDNDHDDEMEIDSEVESGEGDKKEKTDDTTESSEQMQH